MAVVGKHSTGEGGELRPKGPTGGKASPGRASEGRDPRRDIELTNSVTGMFSDCRWVAAALRQSPHEALAVLRNRMP